MTDLRRAGWAGYMEALSEEHDSGAHGSVDQDDCPVCQGAADRAFEDLGGRFLDNYDYDDYWV